MTSLAATSPEAAGMGRAARDTHALSIAVVDSLVEIEATWRAFEIDALASPYQRFDWIRAYVTSIAGAEGAFRVVVWRDPAERIVMMLPAMLSHRYGLRIAVAVGGKHANLNQPLVHPGFALALTPARLQALLRDAGRSLGVDVLSLSNVPVSWAGEPAHIAALGRPSPSNAYGLRLGPDADATLARSMSASARKKLRNKERGLAKLGQVAILEARSEADIETVLAAFFHQKRRRVLDRGIPDAYVEPDAQDFLRRGSLDGLAAGRPAIELWALTLDGAVIAAFGGAGDRDRLSGMFVSFDSGGDTDRFSPGEILVTHVIRHQCERGRRVFDLGVGEARYKRSICDEVEPLFEIIVPVTLRGRLFALVASRAIEAKRRLKANEGVMRLIARVRRSRAAPAAP